MTTDYLQLLSRLIPRVDGEDPLRLRAGTVDAVNADGTVDLVLSGLVIPDMPVLRGARPVAGDEVQVLVARGQLLVLGAVRDTAATAVTVATAGNNATGTTSSTTFTLSLTTTGSLGVAFIAPPSGSVKTFVRAAASNGTAAAYSLLDVEIRAGSSIGSGTVFRAADDHTAAVHQSTSAGGQSELSAFHLITGLTPGATYNAALAYKSGGTGTTSWNRRYIMVDPVL